MAQLAAVIRYLSWFPLCVFYNLRSVIGVYCWGYIMATITKKELIDRISEQTQAKRVVVKRIIQSFLDEVVDELSKDNRLEFRDFGVFETKLRASRIAQNPKTLERVEVTSKRMVKFKMGRLMREKVAPDSSTANVE